MGTGAITGYIDVAQLVLYAFWLFFFLLVLYLHRESKREGYPLETTSKRPIRIVGFPDMPPPKTFVLPHGAGTRVVPRAEPKRTDISPAGPFAGGMPIGQNGNPMQDGLGPGSWAIRPDEPDLTHEGTPKIVPLRVATDFSVATEDPDPRGQPVYGVDGLVGGTVTDIWVDRSEPQIRYFEVEAKGNRVLLPFTFSRVSGKDGSVKVKSVKAEHLADAPGTANPDQVTLQEEDKICAYYGGGYLYAMDSRTEPLI
jgi:photosynthetic reaction center H subunit